MRTLLPFLAASLATATVLLPACSGEDPATGPTTSAANGSSSSGLGGHPDCTVDTECAPDTPLCDVATGRCTPLPAGHELGWRDGSPGSVDLTLVLEEESLRQPTDLAFNPDRPDEVWVVNRKDDSVIIATGLGTPEMAWERRRDPAASHFMDRPPAIAFGAPGTFATCGDGDNGGNDFIGPALFTSDLAIFAESTPDGLGSHIDMLHSTPFCRGIAHEEANAYWVFNSVEGSLDWYDFHQDHGPGNDDHSDGEILRYAEGVVAGVDDVPSHLFFRAEDRHLYVADTGNKRILKLDTESGVLGGTFPGTNEPTAQRKRVEGAIFTDVVPPGTLEAPSGLEIRGELLYVSDHATSRFYAFDLQGQLVRTLDTGLPPGSLAGFNFGPDGKIYFVELPTARVYRIDPK
jgi:hypothetical protein